MEAAQLYGFCGSPEEVAAQMQEKYSELSFASPEEHDFSSIKQKADTFEKKYNEMVLNNHLGIIKKHDPKIEAGSVVDLGETFLRLMQMKMKKGDVTDGDVILAYEMAKLEKEYFKQATPDNPGPAAQGAADKEYYTPPGSGQALAKGLQKSQGYEAG